MFRAATEEGAAAFGVARSFTGRRWLLKPVDAGLEKDLLGELPPVVARLVFRNDVERTRAAKWGITDLNRKYRLQELVSGDVVFSATGVTDGSMLRGVRREGNFITTESVVMRSATGTVRWIKARHREKGA